MTDGSGMTAKESAGAQGIYRVDQYDSEADFAAGRISRSFEKKNAYTNLGGQLILDAISGVGSLTLLDNTNSYIGAGDSATAFATSQTDLQATTNKLRKGMDVTFPSRSGQVLTFRATFGSSEANYTWNEVALFNASSGGIMVSRIAQFWGTKASGSVWVMTYTITVPA